MNPNKQALGGTVNLPGVAAAAATFLEVFSGNLLERSGAYDDIDANTDTGVDENAQSIRLTIDRVIPDTALGGLTTELFSLARLTWNAGRGGGNHTIDIDVGPGGSSIVLGAVTFLKVEIAHIASPAIAADFNVSWVKHEGGQTIAPTYTSHVGTVAGGTDSARFRVPGWSKGGALLSSIVGVATDRIDYYRTSNGAVAAFAVAAGRELTERPVPADAEFFSVHNGNAGAADYTVVWSLQT